MPYAKDQHDQELADFVDSHADLASVETVGEAPGVKPHNLTPALAGVTRSQKIAVASLAFFAVLVVSLWAWQLSHRISTSLPYNQEYVAPIEAGEPAADDLNKDTDSDGIPDYQELNLYKTSPYLNDSDSDGFTDKEEIDSNNDPNCPTGQTCSAPVTDPAAKIETEPSAIEPQTDLPTLPDSAAADFESVTDAAGLRAALLKNGISQAILDQVSDEDLMTTFADVLAEQGSADR